MSFDLQTNSNERKVDAFIRPAIVFNTRQDMRGHIVVDCIDKYGNALLGCYFIGPPGAAFNFAIPSGEQVIVIKAGLDGNNYIIGQAATTSQNIQAPTQTRPAPTTSVNNYTTTHAGDYEVRVDSDARLNLNANVGATIDGRNINLQLHGGVLRIAQDSHTPEGGRSEEQLLNAYETIIALTDNYEKLLQELARMRDAIRTTNAYAESLQNALSGLSTQTNPITGAQVAAAVVPVGGFSFINANDEDALTESFDDYNEDLDRAINRNITVPLGRPEVSIQDAQDADQLGES